MNLILEEEIMVSFKVARDEAKVIHAIAIRALMLYREAGIDTTVTDIAMDLTATHANGCSLRLNDLYSADDFNLMHDVCGINRHLDHNTGKLGGCFLPRFIAK